MIARIFSPVARYARLIPALTLLALAVVSYAGPGQEKIDKLNFPNTDVTVVLNALADLSGANIIIGPDVKGTISIKLADVTTEQALELVTRQAGLAWVESNGTYIVNTPTALSNSMPPAQYLVLKLQVLSTADATSALALAYKDVGVKELPDHRLVLTASTKDRLAGAKAFLEELDVLSATGISSTEAADTQVRLYEVKNLVPWQVKKYLENFYMGQGLQVQYAPGNVWEMTALPTAPVAAAPKPAEGEKAAAQPAPTPVVITDWQSKRLLLRGPAAVLDDAMKNLELIDVNVPTKEVRVATKRVLATHAIANLLERYQASGLTIMTAPMTYTELTYTDVKGISSGAAGQIGTLVTRDKDGKLSVGEPVGDFILRGPASVVEQAEQTLATIDTGPEQLEIMYTLRYLKAKETKAELDTLYKTKGLLVALSPGFRGMTPKLSDEGSSGDQSAQEESNAYDLTELTLRGPSDVVKLALDHLALTDRAPSQVSISTEILSLKATDATSLGVTWGGPSLGTLDLGLSEANSGDPLKFGRIIRDPINLRATINALQQKSKVKLISRPSTVVRNGAKATIHVGEVIVFERLVGFSSSGPQYASSEIQTGVTLGVRPLISAQDGTITLEISTNVAEPPTFRRGQSGTDLPFYRENYNTTIVTVRNGETLVIGGLMQTSKEEIKTAVPIISKIPLIGRLFTSKRVSPTKNELLIMVTPTVLGANVVNPIAIPAKDMQ